MSEQMPVPRVRNSESISSKNTMTGTPSSHFSRARSKIRRIWRSVSPTYLLSSSGPLMLRKYERVFVVARLLRHALRERVRDRLRDQRLAAARRAVEQDALRRLQVVLEEEVGVQVRQLDRVVDLLDLVVEAADVGVGDVGDLFEHELLDLGPRDALDEQAAAAVHEQVLAGAQLHAEQVVAELGDALLVGAADDQRAACRPRAAP